MTDQPQLRAGFAMGAAYLQQREVRARLDLGRLNAELLATQRMLADSTRMSERLRISRDLHDTLGHHLIALNLREEPFPVEACCASFFAPHAPRSL